MTQSYLNVLVDPDPYFDDWMTASTEEIVPSASSPESSATLVENEEDGITIVSSDASNYGVTSMISDNSNDSDSEMMISEVEDDTDDDCSEGAQETSRALVLSSINTSPDDAAAQSSSSAMWQHLQGGASVLSLSTTESMYQQGEEDHENLSSLSDSSMGDSMMSHSSSASVSSIDSDDNSADEEASSSNHLSLSPSSVPSSDLGYLPSVDHGNLPSIRSYVNTGDGENDEADCDDNIPEWFAAIETNQDWPTWRREMVQVLGALGSEHQDSNGISIDFSSVDPATVDSDLLLAALLSQQEDFLEPRHPQGSKTRGGPSFWHGVAAVVASAVVPVALAVIAGRRGARA